jgi:hypothetical protein
MEAYPDEIRSYKVASNRIKDAIIMFNLDNTVDAASMLKLYLNSYDMLFEAAYKDGDFETCRKIRNDQVEHLSKLNNEIPPELLEYRPILISTDISIEELGFEKVNLKKISAEYRKEIDSYDIPETEKTRLKREANIIDVEHEEI